MISTLGSCNLPIENQGTRYIPKIWRNVLENFTLFTSHAIIQPSPINLRIPSSNRTTDSPNYLDCPSFSGRVIIPCQIARDLFKFHRFWEFSLYGQTILVYQRLLDRAVKINTTAQEWRRLDVQRSFVILRRYFRNLHRRYSSLAVLLATPSKRPQESLATKHVPATQYAR